MTFLFGYDIKKCWIIWVIYFPVSQYLDLLEVELCHQDNVLWLPVAPATEPYSCPRINRCQQSMRTNTAKPSSPLATKRQMCSRSQDCRINPIQTSVTPQTPIISVFLWTEPRTSAWASGSVILNDWPLWSAVFNYNSDSCKDQTGPDGRVTHHGCIMMLFRSYLMFHNCLGY